MKGEDYEPSWLEKLFAQWPGFAGLGCVGAGLAYIGYAKTYPPHIIYTKPLIYMFVAGLVLLGYWAFANDSSKSNF